MHIKYYHIHNAVVIKVDAMYKVAAYNNSYTYTVLTNTSHIYTHINTLD